MMLCYPPLHTGVCCVRVALYLRAWHCLTSHHVALQFGARRVPGRAEALRDRAPPGRRRGTVDALRATCAMRTGVLYTQTHTAWFAAGPEQFAAFQNKMNVLYDVHDIPYLAFAHMQLIMHNNLICTILSAVGNHTVLAYSVIQMVTSSISLCIVML